MRVAVVNCSAPHYNLGARKLADWLRACGDDVTEFEGDHGMFMVGFDRVAVSCVFSWHAPVAREIALRVRDSAEVWAGGPGLFALAKWWKEEVGTELTIGVDRRFDRQRGAYKMTFASRGCPVGCWFCIVPKMEGTEFTLDWDFMPAPVLCDNNLSALPADFQRHIVSRYTESGVPLMDANSGFEPRTFTAETVEIWSAALKGPWRFAFDDQGEVEEVYAVTRLLKDVSPRKKRVYVLAGNEPIASCYERALKVIEWGCEPHCQFVLPLNWLGDPRTLKPRFDWTYDLGRDFCRFFNGHIWRKARLSEYVPRVDGKAPFNEAMLGAA